MKKLLSILIILMVCSVLYSCVENSPTVTSFAPQETFSQIVTSATEETQRTTEVVQNTIDTEMQNIVCHATLTSKLYWMHAINNLNINMQIEFKLPQTWSKGICFTYGS